MARKNLGDDFSPKHLEKFKLTTKEIFDGVKTRKKFDSSDIPLESLEASNVPVPPLKPDLPGECDNTSTD